MDARLTLTLSSQSNAILWKMKRSNTSDFKDKWQTHILPPPIAVRLYYAWKKSQ
jgi:hypothetical protein